MLNSDILRYPLLKSPKADIFYPICSEELYVSPPGELGVVPFPYQVIFPLLLILLLESGRIPDSLLLWLSPFYSLYHIRLNGEFPGIYPRTAVYLLWFFVQRRPTDFTYLLLVVHSAVEDSVVKPQVLGQEGDGVIVHLIYHINPYLPQEQDIAVQVIYHLTLVPAENLVLIQRLIIMLECPACIEDEPGTVIIGDTILI